ncbi:hypothetical protein B9Q31_20105 [Enterobacter kobei]|nr:hypothetical protein A4308_01010 [Enterobacter sp. ODB01]OOV73635.1 hypothetical protein B1742_15230 [Enterobacter kobei]OXV28803.1 hypothetical protein CDL31_20190 [Enterobacter kobei]PJD45075.1 hypothetical protein B9Q33_16150 [Enterobacter kobei]PJD47359.1 hypothetical protein B9Q23_18985 [Enterobacter kobei]
MIFLFSSQDRIGILMMLWISLCVKGYKAGFCCGMQQSVIFLSFSGCGLRRTPYNAPPSTRQM